MLPRYPIRRYAETLTQFTLDGDVFLPSVRQIQNVSHRFCSTREAFPSCSACTKLQPNQIAAIFGLSTRFNFSQLRSRFQIWPELRRHRAADHTCAPRFQERERLAEVPISRTTSALCGLSNSQANLGRSDTPRHGLHPALRIKHDLKREEKSSHLQAFSANRIHGPVVSSFDRRPYIVSPAPLIGVFAGGRKRLNSCVRGGAKSAVR
jgi:hypothetical protein